MWSSFRQVVLAMARGLGIVRLFRFLHRNQIVILTVHGVMDDLDQPLWRPLRPQLSRCKLEEYLRTLTRVYHFVSLAEAVEMLEGSRPVMPYSIVLTFDDGYRNNFTHALPILRRYRVPATFFIATGFLNNPRPFWCDRLDYAIQHASVNGMEVKVGAVSRHLDGNSRESLRMSFQQFRRAAKEQQMSDPQFVSDMEHLAAQLEEDSGHALSDIVSNDDWSATLNWEQVREARRNGVTIGSHTVDHVRLGLVEEEVAKSQLMVSKQDIEAHMGEACWCLCYPSGSYSVDTVTVARQCKYRCAVTTREGLNSVGDDLYLLKRINLPVDISTPELLIRLSMLTSSLIAVKTRVFGYLWRGMGRRLSDHDGYSDDMARL